MSAAEDTKAVVGAYYQAGVQGNLPSFAPYLAPDFRVTAPNYLPWGGSHVGSAFFAENVLHHLPETLDFARFSYDSFIAEGSHAVALITIGVTGTPDSVKISEHWQVKGGLAQSIWVAYFEPQPLLAKLQIACGLPTSDTMMFSVDYPYESSHEAVQGFARTTLSAADREKIAHGNAERLLRIS